MFKTTDFTALDYSLVTDSAALQAILQALGISQFAGITAAFVMDEEQVIGSHDCTYFSESRTPWNATANWYPAAQYIPSSTVLRLNSSTVQAPLNDGDTIECFECGKECSSLTNDTCAECAALDTELKQEKPMATIAQIERGRICIRQRCDRVIFDERPRYKVGIIAREPSKYSGSTGASVWYGSDGYGVSAASVDRMRQVYFNSIAAGRRVSWDIW